MPVFIKQIDFTAEEAKHVLTFFIQKTDKQARRL